MNGFLGRRVWVLLAAIPALLLGGGVASSLSGRGSAPVFYLVALGSLAVVYGTLLYRVAMDQGVERAEVLEDPLTGLPTATLFRDRLQQLIRIAERDGTQVPIVVMGLDRFSEINNTLGRERGDQALLQVTERLVEALRDTDTVARIGGDEFAILLPSARAQGAMTALSKVRNALQRPLILGGLPIEVDASYGVAVSPMHGRDADVLIQCAASAMTAAKRTGVRFEFYAPERHEGSPEKLALVAELREAIERNQLVLFYQPKRSLADRRLTGVEALVRWAHPERGLIPPDLFIPVAEQSDLMKPLTLYVLEEAMRQLSDWRLRGAEMTVAVNVSARNLSDIEFPRDVKRLLQKWSVRPEWIELEVTESSVMADPTRAIAVLQMLDRMGIRLALDDYGAGFTSLSYLRRLPVSGLKIDKSFIQNMTNEQEDALIVRSTIELGRGLGLDVIAEGVETEEVWNQLADLGCNSAQGYYLSRPVPAEELALS